MTLWKKILAVQKEAGTIPKSGYNAYNRYAYSTEADVLQVKELMNRHGLIAFPSTDAYETVQRGDSIQVLLHTTYKVVDVETGEFVECKVLGQGEDKGDKGSYKAATGANKYFYLKFAGAPTGDDPERDDMSESKRGGGWQVAVHKERSEGALGQLASGPSSESAMASHLVETGDLSNLTELKNKIRQLARTKGIKFKDVANVTGVSPFWESTDADLLQDVIQKLQVS